MKIHPDGTLEGTAEELAAYQRSKNEGNSGGTKPLGQLVGPELRSLYAQSYKQNMLLEAIDRLNSFSGVDLFKIPYGMKYSLSSAGTDVGGTLAEGDGKATVLIVKH